uniref:Structural maintenance of chromosomes protein 6 n=1 Tax=Labrus bergylta TaxID=56723 RepID=A0A3Q3EEY7_9LABR
MSKRKLKVSGDKKADKSCRLRIVGNEETPGDKTHQEPSSSSFPLSGDTGLIESVSMKNFMCHHMLGPFQFGLNVNFIVGNNGSGKSAILNALTVGLGGKAIVTNRGVSLKDFVKTGEDAADITINLRNRGPDAYKSDVYGDCISVEHHISCNGTRTCKLKSKSGKLISHKKEELTAILDHFNIQVDNPVSILNQEMSKQFLHTKSESDKYKFFMKATQLEQMKRDYTQIKQTTTVTRQQVKRQEEVRLSSHILDFIVIQIVPYMQILLLFCITLFGCISSTKSIRHTCLADSLVVCGGIVIYMRAQIFCPDGELLLLDRLEERNIQQSYKSKLMRKTRFLASQSNNLKRFGDNVPDLLNSISEAHAKGRFLKRPLGPIGACFSLNDPTLALAVECCLRTLMKTFCCDNYKDEAVLQELMSTYYPTGTRPKIIVCPFSDKLYNIQRRKAYHPECHTLIDVITAPSPVIINCLIDIRAIESVLIIKVNIARRIMQQGESPLNCREAFTAEGDQVYHNRYYTSDCSRAKYLGCVKPFLYEVVVVKCNILFVVLKHEQEKLEAECTKCKHNFKIIENQLKAHEDNIQAMKSDLAQREEELQEYVAKASEISPERQQVSGSTMSIDREITQLKEKIKVLESHFLSCALIREYAEALALYRKKTNHVTDLRGFIDRLDNIMSDRSNRYKVMRRSLSVRCKLYFNNFLIKMNCCGAMIFDHINETLYISVQREDEAVRDTRSLSGGERSFSTVCFMLSLWEITESPFRCLDEFDVYMDMQNRRISLDLLLDLSQRQQLRQFIFITPLTTSSLIKVHQLQGPHNQRETEDEDV